MSNLVVHFEIHASEPQLLVDFYSKLFGWQFTRFGEMEYWAISTGEGSVTGDAPGYGINGGLTKRVGPRPAGDAPIKGADLVVGAADFDEFEDLYARAIKLGASVVEPAQDVPSVGRLAYLNDPDGNTFGMITSVLSDGTDVMAG